MRLMLQEKSIYSIVIIPKGRSSRVENNITYAGTNRGGGGKHNILQYNSKVVYFQNTTITKTYVDYFTIIIMEKMDKHNDVWLIFNSCINLCLR